MTPELLDTKVDPVEEERKKNEALLKGLVKGNVPAIGRKDAPVTIVEFSDFQCPFCRHFADVLNQVLQSEGDRVRVVYHYFPLEGHAWARVAAEGSACAQLQSTEAFWRMYNRLFDAQPVITPDNIKQKLLEFAKADKTLDTKKFEGCLAGDLSLGLVYQDMNLGKTYEITGTPTIFINGQRIGVQDATQLRDLVRKAELESASIRRPDTRPIALQGQD